MKKLVIKILFYFLLITIGVPFYAQEQNLLLAVSSGSIEGTLLTPEVKSKVPLVIIVAGSGPTDRNGRNPQAENNYFKLFAEGLLKDGIASLRYDKRGVGASSDAAGDIYALRLEDMAADVEGWINYLGSDKRFSKIIVAGHSEGSLLGMLALQKTKKGAALISIAGAGLPADELLKEQLGSYPQDIKDIIFPMFDKLKAGDSISNVPPILNSFLGSAIQGYMRSWFKYNPQQEIKKLNMPVLIIQGDNDVQVKIRDAELLHKAQPKASLKIIKNMTHVLKDCESSDKKFQVENVYNNSELPLNTAFLKECVVFIKGLKEK